MEITNIILVILPVLGFFSALFGVSVITRAVCKRLKQPFPFGYVNSWLLGLMVIVSCWQVLNSPITRPTNDIHNKTIEINNLKKTYADIEKPTLKDSSREYKREDLSDTPLLDEALGK